MSESTSSSMMGSVLKQTQDREGVHIDTPHGWVINDVHHAWTKNETYHWETGNIFHMTSGQVLHVNLNTVEVHATMNVLTMHVDITPLNVHIIQSFLGIDVHIEAGHLRKHVNIHGGHHHQLVSNFHQESQAVHIESTKKAQSLSDKAADLLAHGPDAKHLGTMNLEAEGNMTLQGDTIVLNAGTAKEAAQLNLGQIPGVARMSASKTAGVYSDLTEVAGGNSTITLIKDKLDLKTTGVSISLGGKNLTTNATETVLNGKVTIGNPAITGMASVDALKREADIRKYMDMTNAYDIIAIKNMLKMPM